MRSLARPALWAVAAAAPVLWPPLGLLALVLLALVGVFRPGARRKVWEVATRLLPPTWIVGVLLLLLAHVLAGRPWWELILLSAWLVSCAVVQRFPDQGRSLGIMTGVAAAVIVQATLALPSLLSGVGRSGAGLVHPNVAAAGLVIAAATLAIASTGRVRPVRIAALLVAAVALGLALAAGSRGMWLGASLGVLTWVLIPGTAPRLRWVWRLVPVALAVGAGLWVAAVRGVPLEALLTTQTERALVQGVGLRMASERPVLGHGGIDWAREAARIEPSVPPSVLIHAHSLPLHLAAHGGAFALALVLWLLVRTSGSVWRNMVGLSAKDLIGGLALFIVVGVLVVQSLLDLVLPMPAVYVGAWMLALVVGARGRLESD